MNIRSPYKKQVIAGVVIHIEEKTFESGNTLAKARVRTDDEKLWCCIFWNEKAKELLSRGFLDKKIHIEGQLKEDGEVNVKWFDSNEAPRPVHKAPTKEDQEEYNLWLDRHGLVRTPFTFSNALIRPVPRRKQDCVKVNGGWQHAIEYIINTLGGEYVTEQLRPCISGVGITGINSELYRAKLEGLLLLASEHNGDFIEREYDGHQGEGKPIAGDTTQERGSQKASEAIQALQEAPAVCDEGYRDVGDF